MAHQQEAACAYGGWIEQAYLSYQVLGSLISASPRPAIGRIQLVVATPRDHGGARWFVVSRQQIGRSGRSFGRVGIRSFNVTSKRRSGRRSPRGCCPSRLLPWSAWRKRSVSGGSATLAACLRSI